MSTVLVVDDDAALVRALGSTCALAATRCTPPTPAPERSAWPRPIHSTRSSSTSACSARGAERDKVTALDAGADDYVTKPFGMDELLARLRAAIRRGRPAPAQPTIVTDDFTIDLSAGRVTAGDRDVRLTPTEWHLLEVLARNRGRVVDHGRLLTEVWGPAYREQTNYLRVYVASLRRKLEPDAANPRHLLTEAGRGYRFEP